MCGCVRVGREQKGVFSLMFIYALSILLLLLLLLLLLRILYTHIIITHVHERKAMLLYRTALLSQFQN